jgi:hypothetical protein
MRTRVDIAEEHRERLLQLAAERGERSCATVVQEAVAYYLESRDRAPQVALAEPVLRADTRAERARLLMVWLREEFEGLVAGARTVRARLRRSAATAN